MYRAFAAALLAACTAFHVGAQTTPEPIRFARYAHIANDGRIAFTYQDDIWVANADGSAPRRLTAHVARDIMPRFSPDGRWIAFTSNRYGNNDVFIVSAEGGEPKQLTWHSGDDQAMNWSPDGKEVLFTSNRGTHPFGSPLYRVALDGTIPRAMGMDIGRTGMMKQDATKVAFNRSLPSYWRKGYRGNANADIAVQDLASGEITELTDTDMKQYQSAVHDVHPMWGADGQIYFASERDGTFNIWRVAPTGGAPQQVTRHKEDGVQFPAMSPDGKHLIYENDFELYTLDVPGGAPKKLPIRLAFDPKENDIELLTTTNRADGFAPSPNGEQVAVDFHGEIMVVPTEQGIGEKLPVTTPRGVSGRRSIAPMVVAWRTSPTNRVTKKSGRSNSPPVPSASSPHRRPSKPTSPGRQAARSSPTRAPIGCGKSTSPAAHHVRWRTTRRAASRSAATVPTRRS